MFITVVIIVIIYYLVTIRLKRNALYFLSSKTKPCKMSIFFSVCIFLSLYNSYTLLGSLTVLKVEVIGVYSARPSYLIISLCSR